MGPALPSPEQRSKLSLRLALGYPHELPITAKRGEIVRAIQKHQVIIISGETGCGKSTQIPKMCLEAGRGIRGKVGCTQPRRIAAITIAHRIAEELGETIGRSVGYKIRFEDKTSPDAFIKLLTDGMLLAETQSDPKLYEYDTLIIDEAHERSLNVDFLLGIAKILLPVRPDLKLIITSATLDIEKFSDAFEQPPVLEVSGRLYPVEVEYRPAGPETASVDEDDYVDLAVEAVQYLKAEKPLGDILIFMPTEQDILETCTLLEGRKYSGVTVLPLYARLPGAQQGRIYSVTGPKIVVATNVAETSLTIPGIRYVIDTGLARMSQYLPGARINSLPIRPISKSSADQRKGRCGRVQKGLCVRLYSEDDFESRPKFTLPEILRSNLAEVILRMLDLRLGHPSQFPFVDRPFARNIEDGYQTLIELDAVREKGRDFVLTDRGWQMARMPLDPRISRMLLEAQKENCLGEVAVIASALSIRDPRERPPDKAAQADAMHLPFRDPDSDFLTLLNIWTRYHGLWEGLKTQSQKRKFCQEHFLSYPRMKEWTYIHDQIVDILRELKIPPSRMAKAGMSKSLYAAIHKSILSGYLSNIAVHKEKNIYHAAKGREVMAFPGSTLFNKSASWIVAADMVKTSRLFARTAARISAEWLEPLGGGLCRYSHSNPRWDLSRGEVCAEERVTLFGLEVVSGRSVPYGPIKPEEAHNIFIRTALVAGSVNEHFDFLKHNLDLRRRLSAMEEKLRRRDILIGEAAIAEFYSRRLPGIYDIRGLKNRIRKRGSEEFLKMRERDLLRSLPNNQELEGFPDAMNFAGMQFRASYRFAPGEDEDGVTLKIPARLISAVPAEPLDWGVPGFFKEKITALIKGLPKRYRKLLVPVSDTADIIIKEMAAADADISLFSTLSQFVKRRFRAEIPESEWARVDIPKHLKVRVALTDPQGKELAAGRDLEALKRLRKEASATAAQDPEVWKQAKEKFERTGITTWDFGDLPELVSIGPSVVACPGLEPAEKSVNLRLFRTAEEALACHKLGVQTLLLLKFSKDLKFMERYLGLPPELQTASLYFGGEVTVRKMLIENLKTEVFQKNLRSQEEFRAYSETVIKDLFEKGHQILEATIKVLAAYQKLRAELYAIEKIDPANKAVGAICAEIRLDLDRLVPKNFLEIYRLDRLIHLPRYIEAMELRATRAKNDPKKDRTKAAQVESFSTALLKMEQSVFPKASPEKKQAFEEFRWMIEEFKVSLFAPELRTAYPVSAQRLIKEYKLLSS
jgi:ATP-dependent helicase HrpA